MTRREEGEETGIAVVDTLHMNHSIQIFPGAFKCHAFQPKSEVS